ncbi:MAG: M20/M25/M40 family metallo-hydrolase [Chitinophagia bacterium]|nr:M20/M25/M40 family metallo-hydrolase [Chitinophagia bacterium]
MKKIFLSISAIFIFLFSFSQKIDKIINVAEVERIEKILSADDMQGRRTFTTGIDKAADFIESEFSKNKLKYFGNEKSYLQNFVMTKIKSQEITGMLDNDSLNASNVAVNTTSAEININSFANYEVVKVKKEDDLFKIILPLLTQGKNLLILIDTAHTKRFKNLKQYVGNSKFKSSSSQLFILTSNQNPTSIKLQIRNEITEQKLKNVVGILPGKSKKDEYVIFSGHYDHLGIGKPNNEQDSIFNGANDDAAGTTAMIVLSKYFSHLKGKNERTIIFVAFTAEEVGGFGSSYFSKQLNADKIVAMFNIEMIGTESKWGTSSAYITGFEKSNMGKILQDNLADSKFKFEPDPYPQQNLFYRSDNATLAALGVPAHTISTSKMDSEKFYHTLNDEIETLDMINMTEIIKAIALSSKSIVSGKDTPSRVEKQK